MRKEDTKKKIIFSAREVFLKKGFNKTTMEDIVRASGVSKGGVYYYFSSTKEIIFELMKYFNEFYIETNLTPVDGRKLSKEEMIEKNLDLIMEKILIRTEDRKLYMMFLCEMANDKDFKKAYLEVESEFLNRMNQIYKISPKKDWTHSKLISRLVNALVLAQNLFPDDTIFISGGDHIRKLFKEILMESFNQPEEGKENE